MARLFSVLKVLFFFSIGILLIWLVVKDLSEQDKVSIKDAFQKANYAWLLPFMILGILSHVSRAVRWKMLMAPLGYNPKLSNTFFAIMIGYLANLVFPRLGEVSRCGVLAKYEKIPFNESFGTVIAERAIDMLILLLIFFGTLFFQMNKILGLANEKFFNPLMKKVALFSLGQFIFIFGIFLILFVVLFFVFKKKGQGFLINKIRGILLGFWSGLQTIKNIKSPFWFIAHSLFIWLMYCLTMMVSFYSFPETSGLSISEGLTVFIFGSLGVIFTPGGIGAYHKLVIDTLAIYAIPFNISFAFAWIGWTSQLALVLFLGLLSLILLPIVNKVKK